MEKLKVFIVVILVAGFALYQPALLFAAEHAGMEHGGEEHVGAPMATASQAQLPQAQPPKPVDAGIQSDKEVLEDAAEVLEDLGHLDLADQVRDISSTLI